MYSDRDHIENSRFPVNLKTPAVGVGLMSCTALDLWLKYYGGQSHSLVYLFFPNRGCLGTCVKWQAGLCPVHREQVF